MERLRCVITRLGDRDNFRSATCIRSEEEQSMKSRTRRALIIFSSFLLLALAVVFVLNAFRSNMLYFFSPAQVLKGEAPVQAKFRLGGLVEPASLVRQVDGLSVRFVIMDGVARVSVTFSGLLPDLFREGKGVVALGRLDPDGVFQASEVLAKHDENYMPPEVAVALERSSPSRSSLSVVESKRQ